MSADAICACCNGDPNTVCSACGEHSCWAGVMYCENCKTAGTVQRVGPVGDDRGRLDALRAWTISDPPATYLLDDVRWAVREIERHRPDLCVLSSDDGPGGAS